MPAMRPATPTSRFEYGCNPNNTSGFRSRSQQERRTRAFCRLEYPSADRHIAVRPEQIPFFDVVAAGAHGTRKITGEDRRAAIVMRRAEKDDRPRTM
jgi:hypothetical protein